MPRLPEDGKTEELHWGRLRDGLATVARCARAHGPGAGLQRQYGRAVETDPVLTPQYEALGLSVVKCAGAGECYFHALGAGQGGAGAWEGPPASLAFRLNGAAAARAATLAFIDSPQAAHINLAFSGMSAAVAEEERGCVAAAGRAVGALAFCADAVRLGRHIVLLNGVAGDITGAALWFSPTGPQPGAQAYEQLTPAALIERCTAVGAPVPLFLVWDGLGHYDALLSAAARAQLAAANPRRNQPAPPPRRATQGGAAGRAAGGGAAGGSPPPTSTTEPVARHPLFIQEPLEFPARCPLGANCCVGEGGPDRTFATLSAWRTHGTYRDKAEAARAVATAARAAALAAISPDPEAAEDDGGLAEVARALDGRTAPRLVLSDLADMEEVDIVTALAPAGRRT
jgi:hypothetical protein